jgi:hypothetical protein
MRKMGDLSLQREREGHQSKMHGQREISLSNKSLKGLIWYLVQRIDIWFKENLKNWWQSRWKVHWEMES